MDKVVEELIRDYEDVVCKIILYCVAELPFPLGIKKTISVLKGSKSTFVIDHELYKLRIYSIFSPFPRKQIRAIIEALVKAGLLGVGYVSQYKNMPVLKITQKGRDFIAGEYQTPIEFVEDFADRSVPQFDDFEEGLFNRLRELRRKIAEEDDIPAFMVCGDLTLRRLVKKRPADSSALPSVRGIGEKFVQNYGDRFMESIANFRSKRANEP